MSFLVGLILSLFLIGLIITFSMKIFMPDNSAKEAEKFNSISAITQDLATKSTGEATELMYLNEKSLITFFNPGTQYARVYYSTNNEEGLITTLMAVDQFSISKEITSHITDFIKSELLNIDLEKEQDEEMIQGKVFEKILDMFGLNPSSLTVYRPQFCDNEKACVCLCTDLESSNIVQASKTGSLLYQLIQGKATFDTRLKCSEDPKKTTCRSIDEEVIFTSNYGSARSLKRSYKNNLRGESIRGYYLKSQDGVIIERGITGVPMNIQTPLYMTKKEGIVFVCPFASSEQECVSKTSYYYQNEKMRAKITAAARQFDLAIKKCSTNTKDDAACEGALPALKKIFALENEVGSQMVLVTDNVARNGEDSLQGSKTEGFTPFLIRKSYVDIGIQKYTALPLQIVEWFGPVGSGWVSDKIKEKMESVLGSAMYEFWVKTGPLITVEQKPNGVYIINTGDGDLKGCANDKIAGYQYTLWQYDDTIMLNKKCIVKEILYTDGTLGFVVEEEPGLFAKAWDGLGKLSTSIFG